jgi:hypothetical protein
MTCHLPSSYLPASSCHITLTLAPSTPRLRVSTSDPSRSFSLRLALTIAAVAVIYVMAQVNAVSYCSSEKGNKVNFG